MVNITVFNSCLVKVEKMGKRCVDGYMDGQNARVLALNDNHINVQYYNTKLCFTEDFNLFSSKKYCVV